MIETGLGPDLPVSEAQLHKFIQGQVRAHTLNKSKHFLFTPAHRIIQVNGSANSPASISYRGSSVFQVQFINKVDRYHGKVNHSGHGAVDADPVPAHQGMRRGGSAEGGCGQGTPAMVFNKDRGVF